MTATTQKFRFTYRFDCTDWCFEIPALSLEEAKERVKVLAFARPESEAPVLSMRASDPASASRGWLRNAMSAWS